MNIKKRTIIKKRKNDELETFIKEHYAALCAVAVRFVGSSEVAKDIAQEVIIKFWENQHKQQEINTINNFLYTMVKNESLNYLRGLQRENQRYSKLEIEEQEDPQVLNLLIAEDTNQALINAIKTLPLQSARIMRLVLSGYENKEIAQTMGISVNTIKTLKYAAIRKLREYFNSGNYEIE